MPGVDFNLLRDQIQMQDVLNRLGFRPSRSTGTQLRGPCPVHKSHSEHSRSFAVNLTQGRFYCHRCHIHGNVIELWAAVHQQTLVQAAIDLCNSLGPEVPWIRRW